MRMIRTETKIKVPINDRAKITWAADRLWGPQKIIFQTPITKRVDFHTPGTV